MRLLFKSKPEPKSDQACDTVLGGVLDAPTRVCTGCGCLVDGERAKIINIQDGVRWDHAFFCEACCPPFDSIEVETVTILHFFRYGDGKRIEVTDEGKVVRTKRAPAKRRRR